MVQTLPPINTAVYWVSTNTEDEYSRENCSYLARRYLKLSTQWLLSPNPRAVQWWRLLSHISLLQILPILLTSQTGSYDSHPTVFFITSRSSCGPSAACWSWRKRSEEAEVLCRAIPERVLVCTGWRNAAASQCRAQVTMIQQSWLWCMTWGWEGQG